MRVEVGYGGWVGEWGGDVRETRWLVEGLFFQSGVEYKGVEKGSSHPSFS